MTIYKLCALLVRPVRDELVDVIFTTKPSAKVWPSAREGNSQNCNLNQTTG